LHAARSETLRPTDRRRDTVAIGPDRSRAPASNSLLHASQPSLHWHNVGSLGGVELGLRERDLPVIEIVDDVHAPQNRIAKRKEALARRFGRREHESADLLSVGGGVKVLRLVGCRVIDRHDELAGGHVDGDFARELDRQAVVVVAVFAVAEALGGYVGEQGEDSLFEVLGREGPGRRASVEKDGEGGVVGAVGGGRVGAAGEDCAFFAVVDGCGEGGDGCDELEDVAGDQGGEEVDCC
jgi:hypothetical protein